MKDGKRILGIDDAAFSKSQEKTFLTGVVYRGTEFIEDVVTETIKVDGNLATQVVVDTFNKCKNPRQIGVIMIDGISFAGFNLVDIEKVSEVTGKPVVAVTANEPDRESFRKAMKDSGNYDKIFEKMEDYFSVDLRDGKCFVQCSGVDREEARNIVNSSIINGQVPEPIRAAHMIGRAFSN